jgi:type II secretory pathway component PulF
METLSDLLPPAQKSGMLAAREAVKRGERVIPSLEQLGILLPRFALELIAIGEEGGHLDTALERAAEVFRHDLECRMLAEG